MIEVDDIVKSWVNRAGSLPRNALAQKLHNLQIYMSFMSLKLSVRQNM